MSYAGVIEALTAGQIFDGDISLTGTDQKSPDLLLREKHPALQEAYNEYMESKRRYDVLYKLIKVTDKF